MLSNVICRKLTESSEKERAAMIVDKKYRKEGYITEGEPKRHGIASYLTEENSEIIGIFADKVMYGTLSLAFDGGDGLPMDSIYKDEIDIFRLKKHKIGEVVQFALDQDIAKEHLSLLEAPVAAVPLFGYLLSYAKKNEFDYLCISVNPKHVSFYKLLGFEQFGDLKHYASVDAPAVALALKMENVTSDTFGNNAITKMIKTFFSSYEEIG